MASTPLPQGLVERLDAGPQGGYLAVGGAFGLARGHRPFRMTGCDPQSPAPARRPGRCGRSRRRRPRPGPGCTPAGRARRGPGPARRRRSGGRSPRWWRRCGSAAASTMPRSRARRSARPAAARAASASLRSAAASAASAAVRSATAPASASRPSASRSVRPALLVAQLGGLPVELVGVAAGPFRLRVGGEQPDPLGGEAGDARAAARSARTARTRSAAPGQLGRLRRTRRCRARPPARGRRPALASSVGAAGADRGLVGLLARPACPAACR